MPTAMNITEIHGSGTIWPNHLLKTPLPATNGGNKSSIIVADLPSSVTATSIIKKASEVARSQEQKVVDNVRTYFENMAHRDIGLGHLLNFKV